MNSTRWSIVVVCRCLCLIRQYGFAGNDFAEAVHTLIVPLGKERTEFMDEFKLLKVVFDHQLSLGFHVNYFRKKIGKTLGFFSKINAKISCWSKHLIYNTIIKPHFHFWSFSANITYKNIYSSRLQKLQNRYMRTKLNYN